MDKITTYQKIIITALQKHAKMRIKSSTHPQAYVETQLLLDTTRHHYQLLSIGWSDNSKRFVYGVAFHIDIKPNGKVWVQQDNTDAIIVDDLLEGGIPQSDIVLGFMPPFMRKFSDFAVA